MHQSIHIGNHGFDFFSTNIFQKTLFTNIPFWTTKSSDWTTCIDYSEYIFINGKINNMDATSINTTQQMNISLSKPCNEIENLKQWIFGRVAPFALGNILEIGSGSGNISDLFTQHEIPLSLSDASADYYETLQNKYQSDKNINSIIRIDLHDEDFEETYADLLEQFDTLISLNITEHAPYNQAALTNAKKLLKTGGYLIVLVPALFALYRELDQGFKHWHKSNKQYIQKLISKDFNIIKLKYFNLVGIVRMFLSDAKIKEDDKIWQQQKTYHELVPSFYVEDLAFKQIGLSVIAIAEKLN